MKESQRPENKRCDMGNMLLVTAFLLVISAAINVFILVATTSLFTEIGHWIAAETEARGIVEYPMLLLIAFAIYEQCRYKAKHERTDDRKQDA